ncbi:LysR substrate-binding domain-containing protein [Alcaligenes sp. SDU_A2]|uniref:LysR substrate-binding domain-containing protein n=1 Tax=Alcaligenes sp. SDU_A2 TaxID=3136634 RepID=UPI00311E0C28
MNIRFLETFTWIARLGSFRAAANKQHLTQAAVSGRIAALENELQQALFERGNREVRLTPAGRTLLQYAQQMLSVEQELRQALAGPRSLRGRVRLGVVESIVHTWFKALMQELHVLYPELEIELTAESTLRLHDLLKRGIIDVALQTDPIMGDGIRNLPMGAMRMGWVSMAGGVIPPSCSLQELIRRWPVVTFPRGSQPHLALVQLLEQQHVDQAHIHYVSSIAASTQLLDAQPCVGTLPVAAVGAQLAGGHYQEVQCEHCLPDLRLVASWRPDPLMRTSEAVIGVALDRMGQFAADHPTQARPPPDTRTFAI